MARAVEDTKRARMVQARAKQQHFDHLLAIMLHQEATGAFCLLRPYLPEKIQLVSRFQDCLRVRIEIMALQEQLNG